jgi:hypothetical protein
MKIAVEIEALRRMTAAKLAKKYEEVWGREPKIRNREWLQKKIVWKVQEARVKATTGHVSPLEAKEAGRGAKVANNTPVPPPIRPRKPGEPAVGTTLVRRWHDKDLHLKAVEGGYEFDGVVYGSLSAAAEAVTGSHWNGKLFWGLVGRGKK